MSVRASATAVAIVAAAAFACGAWGVRRDAGEWFSPHQDAVAPLRALGFLERFTSLPPDTTDKYPTFAYLLFGSAARVALAVRGDAQADALLSLARERGPDAWQFQVDADFWAFAEPYRDALSDCIVAGQTLTAMFHLLLVLASAWLAAELFPRRARLAAPLCAVLVGFHPHAVFYAHTMNVDTPALAFVVVALAATARLLKRGDVGSAIVAGVAAALAAATKDQVTVLIACVPVALLALIVRWRRGGAAPPVRVGALAVAALSCVATYALAADFPFALDAWLRHVRFGMSPAIRAQYALAPPTFDGWITLVKFSAALFWRSAGPAGAALMIAGFVVALRSFRAVVWFLLAPAFAYWVLFVLRLGLTYPRHLLPAFLPFLVLASGAIAELSARRGAARVVAIVLLALVPFVVWRGVTVNRLWSDDPRDRAAAWLADPATGAAPGERVLVVANAAVPPPAIPAPITRRFAAAPDLARAMTEFDPHLLVRVVSPILAKIVTVERPALPEVGAILGSGRDATRVVAVFARAHEHPILDDIDVLPEVVVLRRLPSRP